MPPVGSNCATMAWACATVPIGLVSRPSKVVCSVAVAPGRSARATGVKASLATEI